MQVLQTAHAETEQVAAQVAADLASAREWAYINASRFSEMQRQLGEYRADLEDTQENLKLTHEKLQEAEAQHAAVGEQLAVTQEQLAAEQVAHGNTHEQLAAARTALDKVKAQYLSTRDQLEAERARRLQLEGTVADLRERLEKLQQLREQQHVAAAAERAKWLEQMADGQKQQEEARTALANMQQEYFNACKWLLCWWS
jgi:chromosome segregation ATPase